MFKQECPDLNGKPLIVYKFRSMTDKRDIDNLLPDEIHLTKIGVIICKFSFDKLPQLWNVFKGDKVFDQLKTSIQKVVIS